MSGRLDAVRDAYRAYEIGDRSLIEQHLSEDYEFFAPPDPGIDRAAYFERCWPGAGHLKAFEFVRLEEVDGGQVLVTYEATRTDGSRFRNTEIHTFDGELMRRTEVYFGWDLPTA